MRQERFTRAVAGARGALGGGAAVGVLGGAVGAAALWAVDRATVVDPHAAAVLTTSALVGVLALLPGRHRALTLERCALAASVLSLVATAAMLVPDRGTGGGWGLLESAALLSLLARAARSTAPRRVVPLCLLLWLAAAGAPLRMPSDEAAETAAFALTLVAAAAAGFGGYLRLLDARRARAVAAVREHERHELARDLHDFVAHHVTGIVVQAQAAQAIRETAPERLDPLLRSIEQAGSETLASMRRLVRVLREQDTGVPRPQDLFAELGRLVADRPGAVLTLARGVRGVRLAPEVETSVHRLVQEALTNVTRHAPGARATRVDLTAEGARLCVEVVNDRGDRRGHVPPGGRGGLGLIGLRERVDAVDGRLAAGPLPGGGWQVTGVFPVLAWQDQRHEP
ncbi:sensor histidine kinase [Streptomyces sp. NPDC059917]|uniref:sensor histidine kinase n=1 Tax=Streptomyces sp. NPDC059917 TaxID=3347002 RepID=UPI0036631DBF